MRQMRSMNLMGLILGGWTWGLLAVGLSGCASQVQAPPAAEAQAVPLISTRWQLAVLKGSELAYGEGHKPPFIRLSERLWLQGFGGCNRISGGYEQSLAWLRFNELAATRKFCAPAQMELEAAMLAELANTAVYRLQHNRLQLLDYKSRIVLEFIAVP